MASNPSSVLRHSHGRRNRAWTVLLRITVMLSFGAAAPAAHAADTLLINGHIYTGNSAQPWVSGLAVTDGRITKVGATADLLSHKRRDAQVIDLGGRTVIPGIIDSHVHTLLGGMAVHGLNLSTPEGATWPDEEEKLVAQVRAHARAHPREQVLFVRGNFDSGASSPSHEILDRAVADRPVVVHDWSEHALWLNARALQLAGITDAPLPSALEERGVIRDANGKPRGVVFEAVMDRVERAVLNLLSTDEKLSLVREAHAYLNRFGITSIVNASGTLDEIQLYKTLRERHELTVRTTTAFGAIGVPHLLTPQFLQDLEAARAVSDPDWVSANLIKFFADSASHGAPAYTQAELQALFIELDRRGYQLMTHALFPAAVKMALDGYQALVEKNGPRDRRLRIEHANLIALEDIGRFSKLSVIASMQPTFCCLPDRPGVLSSDAWQSLLREHVVISFGSDWPCSWPPDPFRAISQAVTRSLWQGRPGFGAGQAGRTRTDQVSAPQERISVSEAVAAYTVKAAYASFREARTGTLEIGKFADLAVLSQDVFAVAPERIDQTSVTLTMVNGRIVYSSADPH